MAHAPTYRPKVTEYELSIDSSKFNNRESSHLLPLILLLRSTNSVSGKAAGLQVMFQQTSIILGTERGQELVLFSSRYSLLERSSNTVAIRRCATQLPVLILVGIWSGLCKQLFPD